MTQSPQESPAADDRSRQWWPLARAGAIAIAACLLIFAVAQVVAVYNGAVARGEVGYDADFYLTSAQRWLETGQFYYPKQFEGPYPAEGQVMIYPPLALYLFVPMVFLPRVLWWIVPLAILGWHLWSCRPAWWSWPIIAIGAATVSAAAILVYGNTDLWSVAFLALACRFAPAAWLLVFKPSLLPLILLFARDKRWWMTIPIVGLLALPFGVLWLDWLAAIGNLQSRGLLYSLNALPVLIIPIVAWWSRTARHGETAV